MAESSEQTQGAGTGAPVVSPAGTQGLVHQQGQAEGLVGGGGSPDPGLAGLSAQPLAPAAVVLIAPSLDGGLCHSLGVSLWMGLEAFTNRPCPDFPLNFVKVIFSL